MTEKSKAANERNVLKPATSWEIIQHTNLRIIPPEK